MKQTGNSQNLKSALLALAIVLFVSLVVVLIRYPNLAGLFTAENLETHTQSLNLKIEQSQNQPISLEDTPDSFHLVAFKLSGKLIGEGAAKIFLENSEGKRFLVFDSQRLGEGSGTFLTGRVVEGAETATESAPAETSQPESAPAEETPAETPSAEETQAETPVEETPETQPAEETPPTETPAELPPVEEPPIVEQPPAEIPPVEQPPVEEPPIEQPPVLEQPPIETPPVEEPPIVEQPPAEIPPVEQPPQETPPIEEPLIEQPPAEVPPVEQPPLEQPPIEEVPPIAPEENVTEQNITQEILPELNIAELNITNATITIEFEDSCIDSCLFTDNLNETSYLLVFEVENSALEIDSMTYVLEPMLLMNATNATYELIEDDPSYEVIIDSATEENGALTVVFHHDANKPLPVYIQTENNAPIDYQLSQDVSSGGENVTLVVNSWDPEQYFEIKVGEHSEIVGFGNVPEYQFDTTIEDSKGGFVEADVEFERGSQISSVNNLEESQTLVKKGKQNIKVKPKGTPINEIEFPDVEVSRDVSEFVRIDDVPKEKEEGFVEVYAIDPTQFNFTTATVTVTATGSELYKCKDWNFTEQLCYGEWTKLMDITPGQQYSFTLTPEDPGFAEINITAAAHLDVNKIFISDIFDEVKAVDSIWSEPIYANEYVRATFEQEMTNGNVINFYVRNAQALNTRIEVYEKNGSVLLGSTPAITTEAQYDVTLSGMSGYNTIFDIKMANQDGNSSAYLEFDYIHDAAIGTPSADLAFFLTDTFGGGDKGNDGGEFDENPIQMNDYGQTTEKCELWDCTAWTGATATTQGYYCSGGWGCSLWNGVTCSQYQCGAWTASGTSRTIKYCSGNWDCTEWNGNYCNNWDCTGWTTGTADTDYSCSGGWNCNEWNGGLCDKWGCATWATTSGKVDRYCSGNWDCTNWNGNVCGNWNCTAWASGAANYDRYFSGGWNCTAWNGNYCDKWAGVTPVAGSDAEDDYYCDRWNCTSWDATKKVCQKWGCLEWLGGGNNDKDFYCSGVFNCTDWKNFGYTPTVTLSSPANGNITTANAVNFSCSATDDIGLSNITFYWNYSGSWQANGTTTIGGSSNSTTFQRANLNNGAILWNCYACNAQSNCNFAPANWTVTVKETTPPSWTNAISFPASPAAYSPTATYQFNVTWTDDTAVSAVLFEHNFAGTAANYTPTGFAGNTTNREYYYNYGALAAGTYYWKSHANDSSNNRNSTSAFSYTVSKAGTTTNLYLNGSQGNLTITYGTQSNATATTSAAAVTLYRNGQAVSNPEIATLAAGTYNYTAVNPGNANYTASSATWFLTVSKYASAVNLLLNGNDANISAMHDTNVNITAQKEAGEGTIELYENGILINSGAGLLTNITSYHALGLKNITVIYAQTENYSASSETHFISVTNELPTLDSVSIAPLAGKLNTLINISTSNAGDADGDSYALRCGDSPAASNLCNSTTGIGERSCAFNSPWADNIAHTIYCRLDDTVNVSSEKTAVFTADNTVPTSTLTAVDGDTTWPYWDSSNNLQTILSAATETGAQCRWGESDVVYSSMTNECSVSEGNINCNLGNIAQISSITYHISCKDQYDNEQITAQNLDVTFGVDYTAPTTYDNYDGEIKLPGHNVTIHEYDAPPGTVISTWYCAPTIGCTPETVIEDGEKVAFNNRATNYLRYYSKDAAENIQDTKTAQIFINNLVSIGALSYLDNAGHSFDVSVTPTDDDSSQTITCSLYHRLNGVGGYSSKAMAGATTKTATISTADGYSALDTIQLYVECTDGLETVNSSAETHQITNSIPAVSTLLAPEDNTVTTAPSMTLQYSSSDLDNDTITYYVYGDANAEPTTLIYSGTLTNYEWTLPRNNNGLQTNYWKVLAGDSYQNSSFSETRDIIVNDTKGISLTDPADQQTDRNVNANYIITITNTGAVPDTYSIALENLNGASTAQLNQSSVTMAAGESKNATLSVTDDNTVGTYAVDVTATSDNDPTVSAEISIATSVFGTLSASITAPSGSPPPIYYESESISFQGNVYDELSNPISEATVIFEPIYGAYVYACTNTTAPANGYYNCTMNTAGMQKPHYYDVRINASKAYYHAATATNNSLFLLSDNQQAELTLYKLATIKSINDSHIVYTITNALANLKGTSQSTLLTDPDAGQSWNKGDLGAETAVESYTLSFARGNNLALVTLNKSNATGYDPIYENSLFAESNQPVIAVPENESLKQLTLVKNIVYKSQTTTNITYEIAIEVINSGDADLEAIEVTDSDINLDTSIGIAEGESWQTNAELLIEKNPQTYTKSFAKTRASASGDRFYSNQLNISIPGYGGPYDVVITSLPSSVTTGSTITGQIEIINQNTEVAEDRVLTTWIEDSNGNIVDIDIRTVYIGMNQSASTSVTLTAPSSAGTYQLISELVWPTATASATKSFSVVMPPVEEAPEEKAAGSGGFAGEAAGAAAQAVCGDNVCSQSEAETGNDACVEDCGYDCDSNGKGESWARCVITITQIPEDIKQDIITLRNKLNQLENKIAELKAAGAATYEAEQLIAELTDLIKDIEEKAAKGEFDFARNLIKNAYVTTGTPVLVKITGGAVSPAIEKLLNIPWKSAGSVVLVIIVIASLIGGIYYKHSHDEATALSILRLRRRKLERFNAVLDKKIDKLVLEKGGV